MKNNKKLPNFFVVGAARSGTTSLYNYLKQHPDIYLSPIKEPNYFARNIDTSKFKGSFKKNGNFNYKKYLKGKMNKIIHQAWVQDFKDYVKLFKNVKNEKVIGEFSVIYLFSKVAAKEIYKFNPNSKIIMLLRNPIERAFSHYKMDVNAKVTNKSIFKLKEDYNFKDAKYGTRSLCLEFSSYYEQVKRYLDIFPKKNVKILFFEDLKKNPKKVVKEVCKFLGVYKNFKADTSKKHNPTTAFSPKFKLLSWISSKLNLIEIYNKIPNSKIKNFINKIYYNENEPLKRLKDSDKRLLKNLYKENLKRLSKIIDNELPKNYF